MSEALALILLVAVTVLTAVLVPFLLQLRKTAAAVEKLAESATRDLAAIAEDVHATRQRLEAVSAHLEEAAERISTVSSTAAGLGGTVRTAVEMMISRRVAGGGGWGAVVAAVGSILGTWLAARARSGPRSSSPSTHAVASKGDVS